MRLPALALLLAAASIAPSHAAGPVRTDDPARVSSPASVNPQPQRAASKNAFGQAMAELARGLRNMRPADAAAPANAATPRKPAAVAAAEPAAGG
ncbi:hypothetical protein [Lysobacter humi (ex Lee et al. 2017)]